MKKLLFIVNPKAGKAAIKNRLLQILDLFTNAGYLITIYPTQAPKSATALVEQEGIRFDLLVCAGGDGTLDEVVTGVMRSGIQTPIGYIPAGSTNDFARSLGISPDSRKAAFHILYGQPFACDIGIFNQSYFVYIAAFGAFTEVSYSTPQQAKNLVGHLAYVLEGARSLTSIKQYHVCVEFGDTRLEDDFIFGMITNSVSVGGFKSYRGSEVEFDDGLFEGLFIRVPKNPIELQSIIGALLLNDINESYMYFFKASDVHITSEDFIPWTLDGEYGGEHREVTVKNERKAINIMRNKETPGAAK